MTAKEMSKKVGAITDGIGDDNHRVSVYQEVQKNEHTELWSVKWKEAGLEEAEVVSDDGVD